MNLTRDDLKTDYLIWDNREPVSHVSTRRTGDVTTDVSDAKRRALTFKEIVGSGGVYTGKDVAWLLPFELMAGAEPKPGDRIVDGDAVSWTVLEAPLNTWRTWYRCACRNLVLAYDLRDTAALMRPANNRDAAGGRVPDYAAVSGAGSLPVRVQETEAVVEDRNGKRQATRKFTGVVGQRIYPQAQDRLVTSDGTVYQLTGWRNADRLELLMELDLEIVT